MVNKLFFSIVLFFLYLGTFAQSNHVTLNRTIESGLLKISENEYELVYAYDGVEWVNVTTENDNFIQLSIPGTVRTGKVGEPQLLSSNQMIEVPLHAKVKIKVLDYDTETYDLNESGAVHKVIPYQPTEVKSRSLSDNEFQQKDRAYRKNRYVRSDLVRYKELGQIRGQRVGHLSITPIRYNPKGNKVKVYNNIKVRISYSFSKSDTKGLNSKSTSEESSTISSSTKSSDVEYTDFPDLIQYPIKYLVVCYPDFVEEMTDFVNWKTQLGYKVELVTTDDIGATSTEIKNWIQDQYDYPGSDPIPSFLLLVGDVAQIPVSQSGSSTYRATDLYYACMDGVDDYFPDMYYGRLPAQNTEQLNAMLDKILYYEQYQFEDDSYLNDVTLIAGVDAEWNPKVGVPTLNYGTENYFNVSNGFSTINTYTSSYSGCYGEDKISVGLINYTAHCTQTSWYSPVLNKSSISGFNNEGKYPLAIGNCCESGSFDIDECIGEAWVRKANGGSIGYIGSVPDTYWWEDFYWSVGAHSPVSGEHPTQDGSTAGVFDAPFETDYKCTDAIKFAGNMAVTEAIAQSYSSDIDAKYYWEAYHTLGDPSLNPYLKQGLDHIVLADSEISPNGGTFNVSAEAYAYVALTENNQIIGTGQTDETGVVAISYSAIEFVDSITLTISKAQYKPYINRIPIVDEGASNVALKSCYNDDNEDERSIITYGETSEIALSMKNIGTISSNWVGVSISTLSPYLEIVDDLQLEYTGIGGGEVLDLPSTFTVKASDTIPPNFSIELLINVEDSIGSTKRVKQYTKEFEILSPSLQLLTEFTINDIEGDNDGEVDKGEEFDLTIGIVNTGTAAIIPEVNIDLSNAQYLESLSNEVATEPVLPSDTLFYNIAFKALDIIPYNNIDSILVSLNNFSYYTDSENFIMMVGNKTDTVQLGEGELITSDYPLNNYYNSNKTQILIKQEELGSTVQSIDAIKFQIASIQSNIAYRQFDDFYIKIKAIDAESIGNNYHVMQEEDISFHAASLEVPYGNDWFEITLDTAYIYSGDSDLVIEVLWGPIEFVDDEYRLKLKGSATDFISVIYGYDDTQSPPAVVDSADVRPNLKFNSDEIIYHHFVIIDKESSRTIKKCWINELEYAIDSAIAFIYTNGEVQTDYLIQKEGYKPDTLITSSNYLYDTIYLELNPIMKIVVADSEGNLLEGIDLIINESSYVTPDNGIVYLNNYNRLEDVVLEVESEKYISYYTSFKLVNDTILSIVLYPVYVANFKVIFQEELIEGATLYFNDSILESNELGLVEYTNLLQGNYPILVIKDGYMPFETNFYLQSDSILQIALSKIPMAKFIVNNGTYLLIGANIAFNDTLLKTDSAGCAFEYNLENGYYSYQIEVENHYAINDSILIDGENVIITQTLLQKPVISLNFFDNDGWLPNVNVGFNENIQISDSSGLVKFSYIDAGVYQLSAKLDGYFTYSDTVNVELDTVMNVELNKQPTLRIGVLSKSQLLIDYDIVLNGTEYKTNSFGYVELHNMDSGFYNLEIMAEGFINYIDSIYIGTSDIDKSFELEEQLNIPADSIGLTLYDITFSIWDEVELIEGAGVYVNDTVLYSSSQGVVVIDKLKQDSYSVLVHSSEYFDYSETFYISSDTTIDIELKKRPSLYVTLLGEGDNLKFQDLTLNNVNYTTNSIGIIELSGLDTGYFHIVLVCNGYNNLTDSIYIGASDVYKDYNFTKESDISIEPTLPTLLTLKFNIWDEVDPIEGANIYINDTLLYSTQQGIALIDNLVEGSYSVIIESEGHFDYYEMLNVSTDTIFDIKLNTRPKLFLTLTEEGHGIVSKDFLLNGTEYKTNSFGQIETSYLDTGYFYMEIVTSGYVDITDSIYISNSSTYENLELESLPTIPLDPTIPTLSTLKLKVGDESTLIDRAEIYIDDTIIYTNIEGEALLTGFEEGTYSLRIESTGYLDYYDTFNVFFDTVLVITLIKLPTLYISIQGDGQSLVNHAVTVNGINYVTSESGQVELPGLDSGAFDLELSVAGYCDYTDRFYIGISGVYILCKLNTLPTLGFNVSGEKGVLQGANIYINDTVLQSNQQGKVLMNLLKQGNYPIKIERDNYFDLYDTINVLSSRIVEYNLSIKPNLFISVFNEGRAVSGATVLLDSTIAMTDVVGDASFDYLDKGIYTLKVSKDYFETFIDTISMDTQSISKNITLYPKKGVIHFTVIDEDKKPLQATVLIDGMTLQTDSSGYAYCTALNQGEVYAFEVQREGFFTYSNSIVQTDSIKSESIVLERIDYKLTVKVFDHTGPVVGADVEMVDRVEISDENGLAVFNDMLPANNTSLLVMNPNSHNTYNGSLSIDSDKTVEVYLSPLNLAIEKAGDFSIYPNPTTQWLTIQNKSNSALGIVKVYQANGLLISESVVESNSLQLDLSHFAQGMYLIELVDEDGVYYERVLKNRP